MGATFGGKFFHKWKKMGAALLEKFGKNGSLWELASTRKLFPIL
jgi:hypothetical protein